MLISCANSICFVLSFTNLPINFVAGAIKDVIASDKNLSINKEDGDVIDDDVFELTDIIDDTEDKISAKIKKFNL